MADAHDLVVQVEEAVEEVAAVIQEAHELLDGAGIPKAQGQPCDDPSCKSALGHRLRTLLSQYNDLQEQLKGKMRAR